ncbi:MULTISPECIES: TetR family transcriptional regulator [unclassified Streptomyces]|jgi:AcrR family transcriptional regulator|uniref:TetR family transcriptional regulator n=1 Tax=unclassified Streptomyces TaxID=2593676 RepID=UPI000F502B73|nr:MULTISPECIES: TetR family transcriptional regulator [unclassified Streptomyces]MDH6449799.1 AcrR family transcriptional regulator [Streptomyces sp. SAI-119]MDH6499751.1 AcrR family transcriptional regulator [Streptomyces sp. SAI-149]GLP66810.1 TetR family transcriptional regulator [Streptomyces sp. TUS-ST3]
METLRERKKHRTREALLRVAIELFTTRGYERTTVDDIADSVGVSQRTFFRYFAGKEDAALALDEMTVAHFVEGVRARPPHEVPLEALRQAVLQGWDTLHEVVESVVPVERFLAMYRVIESTPVLLAAHLRRSAEVEEVLARVLAEREGLDAATDPRPRLLVAVFSGVMRVTERQWLSEGEFSLEAMRELTASHLELLGPALTGKWPPYTKT